MESVIQHSINALSLGSLYALLALGIALIFGIMRLVNFAHGELVMVTGYTLLLLNHASPILVVPMAVGIAVVVALLMPDFDSLWARRGRGGRTLRVTKSFGRF